MIAIFGASLIPRIATHKVENTGAGKYRKNSMNGSISRSKKGKAPQRIPSGTPKSDEIRNPRKTIRILCPMLS